MKTESEWLEVRRQTIGSSESPIVLGLSPHAKPVELWARKLELIPAWEETPEMRRGKRLEPYVAAEYEEATGRKLVDLGRTHSVVSEEDPLLSATVDRVIVSSRGGDVVEQGLPGDRWSGDGICELKTVKGWLAHEWAEEPPVHYQLQLQHQLFVMGKRWGSLAALIGGDDLVYYDFERDDQVIAMLREEAHVFWRYVERREQPPVDGSASTSKALAALFPRAERREVALPADADQWAEELAACNREVKAALLERDLYRNQLRAALGAADAGITPGGIRFTNRLQQRKAMLVAESEFRVLRRVGGDPEES